MSVLFGLLLQIWPSTPTYPLNGHLSQAPVDPVSTLLHLSCLWKLTWGGLQQISSGSGWVQALGSPGRLEQRRRGIQGT